MVEKQLVTKRDRREYSRKYYETHREEILNHYKEYAITHREQIKTKYLKNKEAIKSRTIRNSLEEKKKVMSHYSNGTMKCTRCGFDDIRALTIDHINGGGTNHRRELNKEGANFYRWLRINSYPDGYQVLCCNCQWIKRDENHEYKGIAQRIQCQ